MEPQQSGSSRRVAQAMQAAGQYNTPSSNPVLPRRLLRQESDNTPPENPAVRKFKIEDYKTIKKLFNKEILNDSFENCPPSLKKTLSVLVDFSTSENSIIRNNLPNRFIFVGPSGCGKTLLAYAIGYKIKTPYVFVKSSELSNSYKSSCPDIVNELFKPLIDSQQPGLIILDEFMGFVKKFENKNDSDSGAVEHLWQTLDEAKIANPRLIVICTANDISTLPAMILTRFGGSQHRFEHPSDARRENLINQILPSSKQNDKVIENIVKQTKNISLRELSEALKKAQFEAAIRAEKTKTPMQVTVKDISLALKPILQEYSERLWAKRKEATWNAIKTATPYVITLSAAGAGVYITWYLHQKQAAQAAIYHEDSKTTQTKIQTETQAFTQKLHDASAKHSEKLQQKQHDATHGVIPTLKQGAGQVVTSTATYGIIAGIKWLAKEKYGIEI